MITRVKQYCMNGARTSRIHQDGAAPGRQHPTLATGGQTLCLDVPGDPRVILLSTTKQIHNLK